jgi:hypothetical protein
VEIIHQHQQIVIHAIQRIIIIQPIQIIKHWHFQPHAHSAILLIRAGHRQHMPSMILNSFPYIREDTRDNGPLALNVIQTLQIIPSIIASHAMRMHIAGRIIQMHNAIIATLRGLPIKIV